IYLNELFEILGLPIPPLNHTCSGLDDAYFDLTWDDMINKKILGEQTLPDLLDILVRLFPEPSIIELAISLSEAMDQPQKAAAAVVYYFDVTGQEALEVEAKKTLYNISEFQRQISHNLREWALGPGNDPALAAKMKNEIYESLLWAHMFGVGNDEYAIEEVEDYHGYQDASRIEEVLTRGNS
ncbi:hypothetical protein KDL45_19105, partial [bacterium]|nr:hypothetical protein [bacterium]